MTDLRQAAQAVIDSWDSPLWNNGSTADAVAALRTALEQQQAEPVAAAPALIEALDHIAKTIERQIELIKDRAPGVYLDKRPVVKSLQSHAKRARDAIAKAIGTAT